MTSKKFIEILNNKITTKYINDSRGFV